MGRVRRKKSKDSRNVVARAEDKRETNQNQIKIDKRKKNQKKSKDSRNVVARAEDKKKGLEVEGKDEQGKERRKRGRR